jgi:hypothetical protein
VRVPALNPNTELKNLALLAVSRTAMAGRPEAQHAGQRGLDVTTLFDPATERPDVVVLGPVKIGHGQRDPVDRRRWPGYHIDIESLRAARPLCSCRALMIRAKWLNAWGKLPSWRRPAGSQHPRVRSGQEAHARDQQQAGVERGGAVGLGEGVAPGVERAGHHVAMDPVAELFPGPGRAGQAVPADRPGHPVGCHPGHDLGVGEVLPAAAYLPQSVVRFAPG